MLPRSPNTNNASHSFWVTCGILLLTTTTVASLAMVLTTSTSDEKKKRKRIAFLGNSIQYFNDCPRLVQSMLTAVGGQVVQNSCLRPGATLSTLWTKGNGVGQKFATPPARRPNGSLDIGAPTPAVLLSADKWNYVLLQDHTQHPARPATRVQTLETLSEHYIPLLQAQQKGATILLLQTFAYRVPGLKDSTDLGDFHAFTEKLVEGYHVYAQHLRQAGLGQVQIVPMGRAVQWLYTHRRHDLWESLYSWDDFHPSPHGTWLQACLIFMAVTAGAPPAYNALWWDDCRYMQPPEEKPLPLPTAQEAEDLRQVAMMIHHAEMAKVASGEEHPAAVDANATLQLNSAL